MGTSVEDMVYINETTSHVVGLSRGAVDPSPFTAIGVYESVQAAVSHRFF